MKTFVLTFCCLTLSVALAEKQPFERYQSIVDRQMFGPLPPGFDPTKKPSEVQRSSAASEKELTQEQEKLQSSIHFSVINVTPDGSTAVGFTDNSNPKSPVHYYLKVGEKRDGWELKEADAAAAKMTIAKDEIEVTLTLGGNSAGDASATTKAGANAAADVGRGRLRSAARAGLLGGSSLRARRLQREQQAQEAKAQADAAAAEKEAERQAQAEQDRQQREAERAEQRQQLLAIQEELKRVREAKATKGDEGTDANAEANADN